MIRIGREIQCLPSAGFFKQYLPKSWHFLFYVCCTQTFHLSPLNQHSNIFHPKVTIFHVGHIQNLKKCSYGMFHCQCSTDVVWHRYVLLRTDCWHLLSKSTQQISYAAIRSFLKTQNPAETQARKSTGILKANWQKNILCGLFVQ